MDPQQELFTALRQAIKEYGYAVYDSALPPANTPYPFVYLGDSTLNDDIYKHVVFGRVSQVIHVWHNNPKKRGVVSEMSRQIKTICRNISTDNFEWSVIAVSQQILPDNTTGEPLLHGVLTVEFKFS